MHLVPHSTSHVPRKLCKYFSALINQLIAKVIYKIRLIDMPIRDKSYLIHPKISEHALSTWIFVRITTAKSRGLILVGPHVSHAENCAVYWGQFICLFVRSCFGNRKRSGVGLIGRKITAKVSFSVPNRKLLKWNVYRTHVNRYFDILVRSTTLTISGYVCDRLYSIHNSRHRQGFMTLQHSIKSTTAASAFGAILFCVATLRGRTQRTPEHRTATGQWLYVFCVWLDHIWCEQMAKI